MMKFAGRFYADNGKTVNAILASLICRLGWLYGFLLYALVEKEIRGIFFKYCIKFVYDSCRWVHSSTRQIFLIVPAPSAINTDLSLVSLFRLPTQTHSE